MAPGIESSSSNNSENIETSSIESTVETSSGVSDNIEATDFESIESDAMESVGEQDVELYENVEATDFQDIETEPLEDINSEQVESVEIVDFESTEVSNENATMETSTENVENIDAEDFENQNDDEYIEPTQIENSKTEMSSQNEIDAVEGIEATDFSQEAQENQGDDEIVAVDFESMVDESNPEDTTTEVDESNPEETTTEVDEKRTNDFAHWLNPDNYDENGKYTGDYKPGGMDSSAYVNQETEKAKQAYIEHLQRRTDISWDDKAALYAAYLDGTDVRENHEHTELEEKEDLTNIETKSESAPENIVPPNSEHVEPSLDETVIEENFDKDGFLTNDGEKITYQEAIDRVTAKAEIYLGGMGVDKEQIDKIKEDLSEELIKQEKEARARGIGDHGIRHLYGNYERSDKYLDSRSDANAEHKLAALIAQVYHDEGYTIDHLENENGEVLVDKSGSLRGGVDKYHDKASMTVWNSKKELFDGILKEETIDSIDSAIGEHNTGDTESIRRNVSGQSDMIVSAVHCSDKIALSEREKLPEILLNDPKMVELAEGMNSMHSALSDEKLGFYKNENGKTVLTEEGKAFIAEYHKIVDEYIDSKGYNPEQVEALKTAVYKDFGSNSGKFNSRMNYIYTPSDCFRYDEKDGCNVIEVFKINHGEGDVTNDLQNGQLKKMLEDFGANEQEVQEALTAGEYKGNGIKIIIGEKSAEQIRNEEAEKFQENNDIIEMNECIEKGRNECAKMGRGFLECIKAMDPDDVKFDEYFVLCKRMNLDLNCSQDEFENMSAEEKVEQIKKIISDSSLDKARKILERGDS
ncbi:MAG: hypothetical protein IJE43_00850 [Alphaproteobacteria bacterium]|nr:hypothetical protein [Alphaproteobacteria bacterium]